MLIVIEVRNFFDEVKIVRGNNRNIKILGVVCIEKRIKIKGK